MRVLVAQTQLEHYPHFQIDQERFAGLSARNPADPH